MPAGKGEAVLCLLAEVRLQLQSCQRMQLGAPCTDGGACLPTGSHAPPGTSCLPGRSCPTQGLTQRKREAYHINGCRQPGSPLPAACSLQITNGRGASVSSLKLASHGMLTPHLPACPQIAYELDEDFQQHLPVLLHVGVVCLDHEEATVAAHAQQLLTNLVYSLCSRWGPAGACA